MTREETKEAIRIMQAYVDGKKIESKDTFDKCDDWSVIREPIWDWDRMNYRIAPNQEEPKEKHYRPYTMEEFVEDMHKHDGFVKLKDDKEVYGSSVKRITLNGITTYCLGYVCYKQLFDLCVWSATGTPCGKEVAL